MIDLPPATAEIECNGAQHRITWRAGELSLEDHDLEAERTASALGGELPACLELYDAWGMSVSPTLLSALLWPAPDDEPLVGGRLDMILQRLRQEMYSHLKNFAGVIGRAGGPSRAEIFNSLRLNMHHRLLVGVPPALRPALVATVLDRSDAMDDEHLVNELMLDVHLKNLLGGVIADSVASWVPSARLHAENIVSIAPAGASPTLRAEFVDGAHLMHIALPLSWLALVWARGLVLVDDCFVLEALETIGDSVRVRAAIWKRRGDRVEPVIAPALAMRTQDGWRLAWE
jgi:hypothetical protein